MMGEFRVHRCRFFEYSPGVIQCIAYNKQTKVCAISRADGSVELWSIADDWYQYKVFAPHRGCSVEALIWCGARLFSAGLHCMLHEYNIHTGQQMAGTEDGCVVIYDVTEEGLLFHKTLDKQDGRILCVAWYEPEALIVTGGIDHLRVWSYNSGHAIQRLTLGRKHTHMETIVWAVAVTSDFTIVSGDSRGKTCFWNGRQGTLIKAFQSHKEAVLSLCLSTDGSTVFSSGVDPTIVQFEFIATSPDSDWKMWVRSMSRSQHTHDVRALTMAEDCVISGGVDCQLLVNFLDPKENTKPWRRIPPVPQHGLVHVAVEARLVLLQYPNYIELWQLGSTAASSEKNGEILPLKSNAVKLLQLRCRGDEPLVSCAVSHCGKWLAYSDSISLRIFHVSLTGEVGCPQVSLSRVRHLSSNISPAQCLAFSPDGSMLVSITTDGSLQVLTLDNQQLEMNFHELPDDMICGPLLCMSPCGRYIALTDQNSIIHVISSQQRQLVCSLPHYKYLPTTLAFHPSQGLLLVVYSDMKIVEYDIEGKEYSSWSRRLTDACLTEWKHMPAKITHATYHPLQPHLVVMCSNDTLCVINKNQRLPTEADQLSQLKRLKKSSPDKLTQPHAFNLCSKFKHLLTASVLNDGFLVLVERPPLALMEALPSALKQKQFGC